MIVSAILLGFFVCLCAYIAFRLTEKCLDGNNIFTFLLSLLLVGIVSTIVGVLIYLDTTATQRVMENYHKGKIKTTITTIESENKIIKQDTVYTIK